MGSPRDGVARAVAVSLHKNREWRGPSPLTSVALARLGEYDFDRTVVPMLFFLHDVTGHLGCGMMHRETSSRP